MELSAPGIAAASVALIALGFGFGVAWVERKAGKASWIQDATFGLMVGPLLGVAAALVVLAIQELI